MEFSTIYNVCVASSVICSVIEFKMVLTAYCKQRIIQLYFERGISYGNVANVLTAEGFRLPKQTVNHTEVQETWNDFSPTGEW